MEKITIICDIDKCENRLPENKKTSLDVIFTTEQTEGRSTKPYISREQIHICQQCLDKLTSKGLYITACGAMGHNTYYL